MATHFIADLHLRDAQDINAQRLRDYLAGNARDAEALYVLGDLFDVWIGDDGSIPTHRPTLQAFAALVEAGVPVYFMRGNRDFAVGEAFVAESRMQIVDDPLLLELYGVRTLLSHGDLFCTGDTAHQLFRARYTDPRWRARMLRIPLWLRRVLARRARRKSMLGKAEKPIEIMDVNDDAVRAALREHGARRLIHGHTHRPDTHAITLEGATAERIVLADWRADRAEYLSVDTDETQRVAIA